MKMCAIMEEKVWSTPFVDTHEHLLEESTRLQGSNERITADDWSLLLRHYLVSDLLSAGMPIEDCQRFFGPDVDPADKWDILAPWWPAVRNTGYAQAVIQTVRRLYDVKDISADSVRSIQEGYEETRKPGFYHKILVNLAHIDSCQVNSLEDTPYMETELPDLLLQDIRITGMIDLADMGMYADPAGIEVTGLDSWHKVIDWWFDTYGPYATAAKTQNAYQRNIDYDDIPAETAEPLFRRLLDGDPLTALERKALEDHLFWYAVRRATAYNLPVKMHTGYHAYWVEKPERMNLANIHRNPESACELCAKAPETRFVFMHIGYPYYEAMVALAKQYPNAYIDMCWAWIVNPLAAKDFLIKYLMAAPANKLFTFGGDYYVVEPVFGHAMIARRGIAHALHDLLMEGWLDHVSSASLPEMIMHGNAMTVFDVAKKKAALVSRAAQSLMR